MQLFPKGVSPSTWHALSNLFSVMYQGGGTLSLRASPHIPGSYRDRRPLCSESSHLNRLGVR